MKQTVASAVAVAATLTVAALSLCGGAAAQGRPHASGPRYYTTKTPYSPQEGLGDYQTAPKGFAPVFSSTRTGTTPGAARTSPRYGSTIVDLQ